MKKRIVLNPKDDAGSPSFLIGTAIRCNQNVNLFDLSLSSYPSRADGPGYLFSDFDNIIAEGGYTESLLVKVSQRHPDPAMAYDDETYLLSLSLSSGTNPSYLANAALHADGDGDRTAHSIGSIYFDANSIQISGESTKIFKRVQNPFVSLTVTFMSTINLKNGMIWGSATHTTVNWRNGKPEDMYFAVIGFTPRLYFETPKPPRVIASVWLIEATGNHYLSVVDETKYGDFEWTTDIEKALQFTSEKQASDTMNVLNKLTPSMFTLRLSIKDPIIKEYTLAQIDKLNETKEKNS
jgi:hypothetical protein